MKTRRPGSTALSLTEIGFGTAGIAGLYRACPEEQAVATLTAAWDAGIRFFDTAPFYGLGRAEERLGRFLRTRPRDEVVVSTKVGRLLRPLSPGEMPPDYGFAEPPALTVAFDYSRDGILRSLAESRARTGLDRFDILFVHDIGRRTHGDDPRPMADLKRSGIAALEELKRDGTIAAWGLGVNEVEVCLEVMDIAQPDVILLAGRYTLLDRGAEAKLLPLCRARGVGIVAGGVLNSGILAMGPVTGATFDYGQAPPDILRRVRRMADLAGPDLLAAALQFPLSEPVIASVLIGASDPASFAQSLAALARPVDPRLQDDLSAHALRYG